MQQLVVIKIERANMFSGSSGILCSHIVHEEIMYT